MKYFHAIPYGRVVTAKKGLWQAPSCDRYQCSFSGKALGVIRDSDVLLATKVGGAVGDANVSKLLQDHFCTLLNIVQNN